MLVGRYSPILLQEVVLDLQSYLGHRRHFRLIYLLFLQILLCLFQFLEQRIAAAGAECRTVLVIVFAAHRAIMLELVTAHGRGQFGCKDTGRHGDDRVTGDHYQ